MKIPRWAAFLLSSLGVANALAQAPAAADPPGAAPASVSLSARKVYEQARSQLVQIRTVLKGRASQTSVGSGFFVSNDGLIVTNFHVVSEAALKPDRHDLVYVTADGREAPVRILQIDVLHDLALLKAGDSASRSFDALTFRDEARSLAQGERIYSLGNPLDVGFAVTEGNYNGMVKRSFYPQIFFGGALSGGMSGGPALDQEGHVIGVNVARRVDGEQVSFLVPAAEAQALLQRGRDAAPITQAVHAEIERQLLAHQNTLVNRFIALPWRAAGHPRYRVPVPQESFMRCWGSGASAATRGLLFERSDCTMDSAVFIDERLRTGFISVRHETYDGSRIGLLRFQQRYSDSFGNENVGGNDSHRVAARCTEMTVDRGGLPLRAVICLQAYKKLPALFDLSVLTASLDGSDVGMQGRLDATGLSFDNAQRLTRHYLEGFAWTAPRPPKTASH